MEYIQRKETKLEMQGNRMGLLNLTGLCNRGVVVSKDKVAWLFSKKSGGSPNFVCLFSNCVISGRTAYRTTDIAATQSYKINFGSTTFGQSYRCSLFVVKRDLCRESAGEEARGDGLPK